MFLERQHKESHQHIDVAEMMRPITKWNAQLSDPEIVAEVVRKAFKVAEEEKPGSHPHRAAEDVMAAEVPDDAGPLPRRPVPASEPPARVLMEAAGMHRTGPRTQSAWPATASSAPARRRRFANSPAPPGSRWP